MLSTPLMHGKPSTRQSVLSRRDALTADVRAAASRAIAEEAATLVDGLHAGSIVALYAPKGTEVETAALDASTRAAGLRVVYPRVVDGQRILAFHEVTPGELVGGRFGLREPRAEAPSIALEAIAVFVIPGLAFDRAGGRVGWGRGYYDATLSGAAQALRIGLAFECQLVERVPRDPHDAPLDIVVTETGHYRASRD